MRKTCCYGLLLESLPFILVSGHTLYTFMDREDVEIDREVSVWESEEKKQWRVNPLSMLTLISPRAEPGCSGHTADVSQDEWQLAGTLVGDGVGRTLCYVSSTAVCVFLSMNHVKLVKQEVVLWMDRERVERKNDEHSKTLIGNRNI